jgi:hypothetical protein
MFAVLFAPLLAAALASTQGVPQYDPQATAVTGADKPVAKRALEVLSAIEGGSLDRSLLTPAFRTEFTDAVLASDNGIVKGLGPPKRFLLQQKNDLGDSVRYVFVAAWDGGLALSYSFGIDKSNNLINALYFRPANDPG